MEKTIVKKKKSISPVWILPLIAIVIGAWLITKSVQDAGFDITLRMNDANGLVPGKTQVMYKGIPVGMVKKLTVTQDLQFIDAIIEMNKNSRKRLSEDTQFWVVRPKVSATQITGLETIVSGSYIGVMPGESQKLSTRFTAVKNAPALLKDAPGLHLTLVTHDSSTHDQGAPILFKKKQVGEIVSTHLEKDASIHINILIYEQHAHLVSSATLFWDVSGIQFKANLSDIDLKIGTFKSLFSGGIVLETPSGGDLVSSGQTFPLYNNSYAAYHADDIEITLTIPSHQGVDPGADIKYRNVKIGTVNSISLSEDMKSMVAVAGISKNCVKLLRKGTYIWTVSPEISISGVNNIESVVHGVYLKLITGNGESTRTFTVHNDPPVRIKGDEGLNLVLESESLGSLKKGRPVYYRQVKVGHVTGSELSENRKKVYVYINIHEPFMDLVNQHTKFWNVSGLRIKGGLMTKMKISSESVESLISGGIALATPEVESPGEPVKEDQHFVLYQEMDEKWNKWLEWNSDIVINLDGKDSKKKK